MNVSRKVLSVSLFVVALGGAALACGAEKPSGPTEPAGGPVNSAGVPGGPINSAGLPSNNNTNNAGLPGGPVNTGGKPSAMDGGK